jgi:hypothetical protein
MTAGDFVSEKYDPVVSNLMVENTESTQYDLVAAEVVPADVRDVIGGKSSGSQSNSVREVAHAVNIGHSIGRETVLEHRDHNIFSGNQFLSSVTYALTLVME